MKFTELQLRGAYLIEPEPHFDERGYFSRTFCQNEFKKHGLKTNLVQMSTSFNSKTGQIRGMHLQVAPYQETKIVRCTSGSIYDVIVDLREDSETFMESLSIILSDENGASLYIPKGFAHGFKTLEPNSNVFYMMDEFYNPAYAKEYDCRIYFLD